VICDPIFVVSVLEGWWTVRCIDSYEYWEWCELDVTKLSAYRHSSTWRNSYVLEGPS